MTKQAIDILANNMRREMQERELSVAKWLPNVSYRVLYRIFAKSHSPRLDTIEQISSDLGITVAELLTDTDAP